MTFLEPQPAGIPLPAPSPYSEPFWQGCEDGILRYQRCRQCGHAMSDPGYLCRWCHSPDLQWRDSAGRGTLYSWSTVWRPMTAAFVVPYVAIIVRLDEDFLLVSNLIGCEVEDARAELPLIVEFHSRAGMALPYFRPA